MTETFQNKKWRKSHDGFSRNMNGFGCAIQQGDPNWVINFRSQIDDDMATEILGTQNPLLKITLSGRDLKLDYAMIAQIAPAEMPSSGDAMFGLFMATNQPEHLPIVCVEQITPNQVKDFQLTYKSYRHSLLHEITMRVFVAIFNGTEDEDFSAFGIWNNVFTEEAVWSGDSEYDWSAVHEKYRITSRGFSGYVFGALGDRFDPLTVEDGKDAGIVARILSETIDIEMYGTRSGEYNADGEFSYDADRGETEASSPVQVVEEHTIEPCWKEQRPIVYHQKNRATYWVEETRCKSCGQRIIIHLNKAQCPNGAPDVKIKCAACKVPFQFH